MRAESLGSRHLSEFWFRCILRIGHGVRLVVEIPHKYILFSVDIRQTGVWCSLEIGNWPTGSAEFNRRDWYYLREDFFDSSDESPMACCKCCYAAWSAARISLVLLQILHRRVETQPQLAPLPPLSASQRERSRNDMRLTRSALYLTQHGTGIFLVPEQK